MVYLSISQIRISHAFRKVNLLFMINVDLGEGDCEGMLGRIGSSCNKKSSF